MLIFYFFAVIQLFFSYKSLRGGIDYLNYFKREIAKEETGFEPYATVIVPCRGTDTDLRTNLSKLLKQKYADYEIIFVVDDEKDESVRVIEELPCSKYPSKLIVAGKATDSGQKVHNLRHAVLKAADAAEVLVFVDSDARPCVKWLSKLVAPLANQDVGCSTGYRWFVQKSGGFSTHLRSVWNASIASALGENSPNNFCWGGSTAIRKEVFEELEIRQKWKGTLSDDFVLTRIIKKTGRAIYFVPECITPTVEDCSFSDLLEFTTRQMKITRVYSPALWRISFTGALLFTLTLWGAFALLFVASGIHFWLTLSVMFMVILLGISKVWLRLDAVKLVLRDYKKELKTQFFWQAALWMISPILFLYNNFKASVSRKISWRGIEYKLESSEKTVIISRNTE